MHALSRNKGFAPWSVAVDGRAFAEEGRRNDAGVIGAGHTGWSPRQGNKEAAKPIEKVGAGRFDVLEVASLNGQAEILHIRRLLPGHICANHGFGEMAVMVGRDLLGLGLLDDV